MGWGMGKRKTERKEEEKKATYMQDMDESTQEVVRWRQAQKRQSATFFVV